MRQHKNRRDKDQGSQDQDQWIEKVVQIRRVTKVVKGGKRLSFPSDCYCW